MLIALLITCCMFRGLQSHLSLGHYTIVAPGSIRSNSDYHVSVSLDEFTLSCWFNISVETLHKGFPELVSAATVEVEPRTTKLVKMQIPKLYYGYGVLKVLGYRGIISEETSQISIEEHQYTSYIQTDKSKYRPGEMMQFRVIFIDRLTRPAQIDEIIDVNIYDGEKNLIRKFSDIELVQGVFRSTLQLSEHLVMGEWNIEVRSDGATLEQVSFEVARYILPKFSVEIDTQNKIPVNKCKMVIRVKSSYTYSQPVTGNLTINLNSIYATNGYPTVTMTDEFFGETVKTLDLAVDLGITEHSFIQYSGEFYRYTVTATVTEALTGESHSGSTEVSIYNQPFKINLEAPSYFQPNDLVNITVSVTDLENNPIRYTKNPISITVEPSLYDMSKLMSMLDDIENFQVQIPEPVQRTVFLNDVGVGAVSFKLSNDQTFSEYEVKASYLEYASYPMKMERASVGFLNIDVLTENPEVGKELMIGLTSEDPIDHFIYEIVSRGDITQSQLISVPDNKTTHLFTINATHSMVPKITLFVHRVTKGVLRSRLKDIQIRRTFQNSINITSEDEVLPGSLVSLNITTDEGSYVGLMGIDERLLLATDYKTTLTEDSIYTKLRNYDSINIDDQIFPGGEAGLITFSNARNRAGSTIGRPDVIPFGSGVFYPQPKSFDKPSIELPRVRKFFSESWMFADFQRTTEKGLTLLETIPDTITSWAITGFSLNPNTGLTLTKNATKLKVFQPLFISMDLPSLVREGEIIEIPVYIFNYMDEDLLTNVTINNADGNLDILDNPSSEPSGQPNQTLCSSISSLKSEKFVFRIRPRSIGRYNVTVKAITSKASDAVQKPLTVVSYGVPYSFSKTHLLHLAQEESVAREDEILVDITENAIPGSENIQLLVIGDTFGPLMRSLQNLVRVPFGNSENNMRLFVSNLLVVKYLKTSNHSSPSLEKRAKLHMELGYQTQLTFKHLDGSFSLLDRTVERTGDTWLTAYTIWALKHAKNFIQLDVEVIKRSLAYLKSKQNANGGFDSGRGVEEDAALTAFIILTFLVEEESQSQYEDVITNGLKYLYDLLDDLEHPTSTAISTYALVLGKHEKSKELLDKLSTEAALKSAQLQWSKPDSLKSNLETTAYSLMSLLESHQDFSLQTLFPILRTLSSVGDANRTPVFMIALEAMIKFAHRLDSGTNNLSIHYEDDQGESGDLYVNSSNSQVLQQVELKKASRRIKLRTTGKGFALVTVSYKYNMVPLNISSSDYTTNVTIKNLTDRTLVLNVCVATQQLGSQSDLTIMEVNLPSGYTIYEDSFDSIKQNNEQVKSIELNENHQSVRAYLENLSHNGTCIQMGGTKTIAVFNTQPISVVVYDFKKDHKRSVLYHKVDLETKLN